MKKYCDPNQRLNQIFSRVRRKAIVEDKEFDLTKDFLFVLLNVQEYKCALTDILFDYSNPTNGNKRNPLGPSLDRIDSKKGYTIGNVQFVCWVVNAVKNEYDIEIFDLISEARVNKLNGS